jgi:hypothetical protein
MTKSMASSRLPLAVVNASSKRLFVTSGNISDNRPTLACRSRGSSAVAEPCEELVDSLLLLSSESSLITGRLLEITNKIFYLMVSLNSIVQQMKLNGKKMNKEVITLLTEKILPLFTSTLSRITISAIL